MMDMWRIIEQSSHGENAVRVVPIEYTSIAEEVYRYILGFRLFASRKCHPNRNNPVVVDDICRHNNVIISKIGDEVVGTDVFSLQHFISTVMSLSLQEIRHS